METSEVEFLNQKAKTLWIALQKQKGCSNLHSCKGHGHPSACHKHFPQTVMNVSSAGLG
jgi:hypothetical protein